MERPTPPIERLIFFRNELNISSEELDILQPYARQMAERGAQMAKELYKRMGKMAQTKIILDHQTSPKRLQSNWMGWYTMLWERPCDDAMLATLWHSGLQHVTHGVDHRFITLAYSQVRRYSHQAITDIVAPEDSETLHILADKLFDLCILVESDAYITAQTHCNNDVMMGIAHQIRNPLTIIGGMASRLLRLDEKGGPMHTSLEAMLGEAGRMERMLQDLVEYIKVLRSEPSFATVSVSKAIEESLEQLEGKGLLKGGRPEIKLDPAHDMVQADAAMIRDAFFHLLDNALEANNEGGDAPPVVLISRQASPLQEPVATGKDPSKHFITVELCNVGELPETTDLEGLFQPFHSTKPYGTGLGLSIARLAVQKNFGTVQLTRPSDDEGASSTNNEDDNTSRQLRCLVTLVKPGHVHDSGLFFSDPETQEKQE